MKFIKSFKLFEEGGAAGGGSGVGAATGGSGMGAVSTSSPSSTPGDVGGATTGSGDIGSGWDQTVQRKDSNELKSKKKKKKKKN